MGFTTRAALGVLRQENKTPDDIRMRAKRNDSESNGSLMRITPLAVYCSNIKDNKVLEKTVISDTSFTHSSMIVQMACVGYCIAIRELINGKGAEEAYQAAK